jgi:hypothetical protein
MAGVDMSPNQHEVNKMSFSSFSFGMIPSSYQPTNAYKLVLQT